jgi:2,4-dienoyl-CoA reductase-like NADH-dependent reductase (Old Yellow Enzyme family)
MTTLFDPIRFGDIAAANRIVMAALTRNRAGAGRTPTQLMATNYEQRATALASAKRQSIRERRVMHLYCKCLCTIHDLF